MQVDQIKMNGFEQFFKPAVCGNIARGKRRPAERNVTATYAQCLELSFTPFGKDGSRKNFIPPVLQKAHKGQMKIYKMIVAIGNKNHFPPHCLPHNQFTRVV